MSIAQTETMTANMPTMAVQLERAIEPRNANAITSNAIPIKMKVRAENALPALIRFFQSKAIGAHPRGRSVKGERFFLKDLFAVRQLPERAAATFSASFFDASTDASSNATSARTT